MSSCLYCFDETKLIELRRCKHEMCRDCLANTVLNTALYPIQCPECSDKIDSRDIEKYLTEEESNRNQDRQRIIAILKYPTGRMCQGLNCSYPTVVDTTLGDLYWSCPKCQIKNCYRCKTVHRNEICEDFNRKDDAANAIQNVKRCVKCGIYIRKKHGCEHVQCPTCNTEICWKHDVEFQKPGCNCCSELRHIHGANYKNDRMTVDANKRLTKEQNKRNPAPVSINTSNNIPRTNSTASQEKEGWCVIS